MKLTTKASRLLRELAEHAEFSSIARSCRRDCRDVTHFHNKPGAYISAQSDEKRRILKGLKSEDI